MNTPEKRSSSPPDLFFGMERNPDPDWLCVIRGENNELDPAPLRRLLNLVGTEDSVTPVTFSQLVLIANYKHHPHYLNRVYEPDCRTLLTAVLEHGLDNPIKLWHELGYGDIDWFDAARLVLNLFMASEKRHRENAAGTAKFLHTEFRVAKALPQPPAPFEFGDELTGLSESKPETPCLIDGILKAGFPGVIIGPEKAGKTCFTTMLATSLAGGVPFLGRFAVKCRKSVWMVSGETPKETVHTNAARHLDHAGGAISDLDLTITEQLPQLTSASSWYDDWRKRIRSFGHEVLFLDSLSNMAHKADYSRQAQMVEMLNVLTRLHRETGCDIFLNVHAKSNIYPGRYLNLGDIKGDGIGSWAAQWFLLNRWREFDDPDRQSFVVRFGSRHPTCGKFEYTLAESTFAAQVFEEGGLKAQSHDVRVKKQAEADELHKATVLKVLTAHENALTANRVSKAIPGLSFARAKKLLPELVAEGLVAVEKQIIRKRSVDVFSPT